MLGELVRCIAIDFGSSKYGFAVLEGSLRLIDWGQRRMNYRRPRVLTKGFNELADRYPPDFLVVKRHQEHGSLPARGAIDLLAEHALESGIGIRRVSRQDLRRAFPTVKPLTKHEMAIAVAGMFPELTERLPEPQQRWQSEDARHSLFQAVAIGFAALYEKERQQLKQ